MLKKTSALLAALTAAVHIVVGGADALTPTLAAGLPLPAEGAMHACWHMVTAFLLWSIVVFWRGGTVALHCGGLWLVFACIFIYSGTVQDWPQGLLTNPQWTILGITGGIAVFANRYHAPARLAK